MRNQLIESYAMSAYRGESVRLTETPDVSNVSRLTAVDQDEAIRFLNIRPVHTVVMTSFIRDNGIDSPDNRGIFWGYRNPSGELEGVALIGHSTLVEARSQKALKALAFTARTSETPLHLIMSSGSGAETFWEYYTGGRREARLSCVERLFELRFPFSVPAPVSNLRLAGQDELAAVAAAQAEIAEFECGRNPLTADKDGFLRRVARRINQNRVFVVVENDQLIFKADIIAETAQTAYLEGVYLAPEYRGKGLGSRYLAAVSSILLGRVDNICLLSNVAFAAAHKCYEQAGYRHTDTCTTLFV